MKAKELLLTLALGAVCVMIAFGQGQPRDPKRTPGLQAGADPNRTAVLAQCKNPPPAPANRGAAPAAGTAQPAAPPPPPPAGPQDVTIPAIPGVIGAGQKWKLIWSGTGNNADGIVGLNDGSLLVAQNDNSTVLKIDKDGKTSIPYTDTYTGGALTINTKGVMFVAERALNPAIWQLTPQRKLLANTFQGDPLDCLGGVLNDMSADSKGGVYFTMAGVYYANPRGVVMGKYGNGGNGIILSRDEKTLYVTGRLQPAVAPAAGGAANNGGLVAWDVQPDGTLANPRQFADVGGDGSTIDSEGRIYTTGAGGIFVVAPDGKTLGTIPTPRNVITAAFGGPDKKTLYTVFNNRMIDEIYALPMIAQGFKGRAK